MKQYLYILFFLFLFLNSCKSYHKTTYNKTRNVSTSKLLKLLKKHQFKAKTFESRIGISYKDNHQNISGNGRIKILKDSIIWGSLNFLGIPMVKFYITPHKIQYYNKINQDYYDGNFDLVKKQFGINMNFQHLQHLLLGDLLMKIPKNAKIEVQEKYYVLNNQEALLKNVKISPFYKVLSERLQDYQNTVNIQYINYQSIEKENLPKEIIIQTTGQQSDRKIELKYKNIKINKSLRFPFKIPENYHRIEIKN